jgi:hypothetical protein
LSRSDPSSDRFLAGVKLQLFRRHLAPAVANQVLSNESQQIPATQQFLDRHRGLAIAICG